MSDRPLLEHEVRNRAIAIFFGVFIGGIVLFISLVEWALRSVTP